jgi:hypothetical protein
MLGAAQGDNVAIGPYRKAPDIGVESYNGFHVGVLL